jgi:hypothetical protein
MQRARLPEPGREFGRRFTGGDALEHVLEVGPPLDALQRAVQISK